MSSEMDLIRSKSLKEVKKELKEAIALLHKGVMDKEFMKRWIGIYEARLIELEKESAKKH